MSRLIDGLSARLLRSDRMGAGGRGGGWVQVLNRGRDGSHASQQQQGSSINTILGGTLSWRANEA